MKPEISRMITIATSHITKETAKNLYIGIVGDSGGFKYQHTEPRTFITAGELVSTGLDVTEITQNMFLKPRNDLDLKKYILNTYEESEHGVAYYILTDKTQKKLGIETEQGKESINIFANIEGINAWVSATEDIEDPTWKWRISIRSKTTPINGVASHFNGGGHENASGAKLKKIEHLPELIKELDDLFAEVEKQITAMYIKYANEGQTPAGYNNLTDMLSDLKTQYEKADINGDGKLNIDEFSTLMENTYQFDPSLGWNENTAINEKTDITNNKIE